VIKYLGSKRRLVPVLETIAVTSGARSALDLFTGTTRVAQGFKRQGVVVTAVDTARYAEVFAQTYIETDASGVAGGELAAAIGHLNAEPPEPGYVTETFCERSRFFQPFNGARIDAVRVAIDRDFPTSPLRPHLLTSLLEAADRVDSTTGVQMAYVKQWAPRSFRSLELRVPDLLAGEGRAVRADAVEVAAALGPFDLAYLDPPYNQHRYFTNYHVWETLVAWDAPEHYGVACKRADARDSSTRSAFNAKRTMPDALAGVIGSVDCGLLVLSYNDESWVSLGELLDMCGRFEAVVPLAFASRRYVGASIGIHNPSGERVGEVSHLHNREYVVVAGPAGQVSTCVAPFPAAVALGAASLADKRDRRAS
jgi:adenine-specific DNA-methyltransferase